MKFGINVGDSFSACSTPAREPMCKITKDTDWEIAWGNPRITREYIHALKDYGFEIIKLPVTWKDHYINGKISIEWLKRVKEVVDWVIDEDLEVIVNTHHDEEWLSNRVPGFDDVNSTFFDIWSQIATYFADTDTHLVFEGMNEVGFETGVESKPSDYAIHYNLNKLFAHAVRLSGGYNKGRKIIMPGMYTDCSRTLESPLMKYPYDPNYEPAVHLYFGDYTLFKDYKKDENVDIKRSIYGYFQYQFDKINEKNKKYCVSEFGITVERTPEELDWYVSLLFSFAKKYDIDTCMWDDGTFINRKTFECNKIDLKYLISNIKNNDVDLDKFID